MGILTLTDFLLVLGIAAALLVEVDAVSNKQSSSYSRCNADCSFVHFNHITTEILCINLVLFYIPHVPSIYIKQKSISPTTTVVSCFSLVSH